MKHNIKIYPFTLVVPKGDQLVTFDEILDILFLQEPITSLCNCNIYKYYKTIDFIQQLGSGRRLVTNEKIKLIGDIP